MKIKYDHINIEKLKEIVKFSDSFPEVTRKLGYDPKIGNVKTNIERLVKRNKISTEHFSTVQRLKLSKNRYKKENLEPIIKKSKNYREVLNHLNNYSIGGNYETLYKYINLYNIDTSHFETSKERYNRTIKILGYKNTIPLKNILIKNSTYKHNTNLKNRLYKEGLKKRKCELCEQGEEWMGKKMSLILDHINGINNDNRIENLRIVCPNCNATLPTHGGKNLKKIEKIF